MPRRSLKCYPIDLYIKATAASNASRLHSAGSWKDRPYGHSVLRKQLPPDLTRTSDYKLPSLSFENNVKILFPSRKDWKKGTTTKDYDICVYTDGSKMDCGVGAGVFSEDVGINISIRLPDDASVFQAEILAIKEAAAKLTALGCKGNIGIFVNRIAAYWQ